MYPYLYTAPTRLLRTNLILRIFRCCVFLYTTRKNLFLSDSFYEFFVAVLFCTRRRKKKAVMPDLIGHLCSRCAIVAK